jgi:hypothetical protein
MFWQQKPVYANKSEFKTILTVKTDSLPKGTIQLNLNKNGETWDINLKDGKIVSLKKDGKTIPENDFPKYESEVKKIMSEMPPPPPPGVPAPPPPPGIPPPPPPMIWNEGQPSKNTTEDYMIIVKKDGTSQKFIQHKEVIVKSEGQTIQTEEKMIWKDEKGNNVNPDDIDPATIQTIDVRKAPKGQKSETTTVTVITTEKNISNNLNKEDIKTIDVRKSANGEEVIIVNGMPGNSGLRPLNGLIEGKALFVADSINFSLGNYTFQPGNVRSAITSQLINDQVIADVNNFQMELIDGKKYVGPFHAKYLKIYESNTGLKMDSKSKISISGKE